MSKFKLQGVGIDTTTMRTDPGVSRTDDAYTYIMTSLEANNDYLIRSFVENHVGEPAIITATKFLDNIESALKDHKENLGVDKIDLLLVGPEADWDNYKTNIPELIKNHACDNVGLINPTLEDIKKKIADLKELEVDMKYVTIPVSPLEFDLEIINYCAENNIYLIGLNPMGGYLSAPRNIKAFSVPYLLGFSAHYCNIVLLSGRDINTAWEDKWYLQEIIGKESSPSYIIKRSTSKPIKEIKKAIYTSIHMDGENLTIPYDDPMMILMGGEDFKFKVGSYLKQLDLGTYLYSDEEFEVANYVKTLEYPKDGEHASKFAFARYAVMKYLKNKYKDWDIDYINLGNSVLVITVSKEPEVKGSFLWARCIPGEEKQFYLAFPPEANRDEIIFKEVKLTPEDEEKLVEKQ
jgi:hypothetical protein